MSLRASLHYVLSALMCFLKARCESRHSPRNFVDSSTGRGVFPILMFGGLGECMGCEISRISSYQSLTNSPSPHMSTLYSTEQIQPWASCGATFVGVQQLSEISCLTLFRSLTEYAAPIWDRHFKKRRKFVVMCTTTSRPIYLQGKSDGFDSCDPSSNLTQIGFK